MTLEDFIQALQMMSNFVLLYERLMKPLNFRVFRRIDVVFAVVRRVVHSCSAVFVVNFCNRCIIGEPDFLAPLFTVCIVCFASTFNVLPAQHSLAISLEKGNK